MNRSPAFATLPRMDPPLFKQVTRRLRARLERHAICLGRVLFAKVPRGGILLAARVIGDLGFLLARRHKRIAYANIEIICGRRFSRKRQRALVRAHFRHAARVLLDLFWFSHEGRERLARWSRMDPVFLEWLRDHPGGIIVTGHLGNWEVAGQTVAALGFPLTSVAKQIGTPGTTQCLNRYRSNLGQKIVMADGAVRELVRSLQAKEFVALLLDQHVAPEDGGVWVNLFGLPVAVSSSAARLALKYEMPIAVSFSLALPDGRYDCRLIGVCEASSSGDPVQVTQQIMDLMAGAIRRHPSQWLLSYKRWKRWPPGADATRYPFYAKPWKLK